MVTALFLPIFASGQAQINTKKIKIADFTQKVTKVVLSGNAFIDSSLQDEITLRWRVSPYEFCTLDEFNSLKGKEEYYFLIWTTGQFKKELEPSLQFLTLIKGGKGSEKGIDGMLEVVSLPIASAKNPSGRELIFLPAFLDIIQNYTLDSMEKDIKGYGGLGFYTSNINKIGDEVIVFSENDINSTVSQIDKDVFFGEDLLLLSEDDADAMMQDSLENTIVSYTVAPADSQTGTYCYKMLIDTQSHKLYYYKRHRISRASGSGFTTDDLKRIFTAKTK